MHRRGMDDDGADDGADDDAEATRARPQPQRCASCLLMMRTRKSNGKAREDTAQRGKGD